MLESGHLHKQHTTYMGFRLETYSDNWHFKDSVKTRFGNPNMWYMNIFSFEILIPLYEPKSRLKANLAL